MSIRDAFAHITRDWQLICGLALLFLWTWLHYWGGCYSLLPFSFDMAYDRWAANVVTAAITLLLLAGMASSGAQHTDSFTLNRMMRWLGGTCGFAGTVLAFMLINDISFLNLQATTIAIPAGILTGICEGCFLCLWCMYASALGVRIALAYNVIAMLAAGILFAGCNIAPAAFAQMVGLCCPIISLLLSLIIDWRLAKLHGDAVLNNPGVAHAKGDERQLHSSSKPHALIDTLSTLIKDRAFFQLIVIAFLFSVSCGFLDASFGLTEDGQYRTAFFGVVAGSVAAAALAFFTAFFIRANAWQLVFRFSLPLMGIAYVMMPHHIYELAGQGIHALGYQFFFVAYWALLGSAQLRRGLSAAVSVSVGLSAAALGKATGLALWTFACADIAQDITARALVCGIGLLALLLIAVVFEHPVIGWSAVRPGVETTVHQADDYEEIIYRVSFDCSLSPREREVIALLGRGRNRQFVADELGISLETAKSHVTNIYRKIGVHTQQELLDTLDMVRGELNQEMTR